MRQLEFMKAKIDKINKGLRDNFEKRKIDQKKMEELERKNEDDQEYYDYLPDVQLTYSQI